MESSKVMPAHGSTGTLAVLTPSYAPDFELCSDLNRSVLAMTPRDVVHHIVTPHNDLPMFRPLASARTKVHDAREYLPPNFIQLPRVNMWINAARPWVPVRGWITQQVVKLAASASLGATAVLLLDSDSVLIRPTTLEAFCTEGEVGLYRKPSGVDRTLPGHRYWHVTARRLLGLAPPPEGDLTDYICWPCVWEPSIVRDMLLHIEKSTGRAWSTVVASQLRFSEMMLYGIYVDEVLGGKRGTFTHMKGAVHSEEVPLSAAEIGQLLRAGPTDALAVMLSAKAGIPLEVRRRALKDFAGGAGGIDGMVHP